MSRINAIVEGAHKAEVTIVVISGDCSTSDQPNVFGNEQSMMKGMVLHDLPYLRENLFCSLQTDFIHRINRLCRFG